MLWGYTIPPRIALASPLSHPPQDGLLTTLMYLTSHTTRSMAALFHMATLDEVNHFLTGQPDVSVLEGRMEEPCKPLGLSSEDEKMR